MSLNKAGGCGAFFAVVISLWILLSPAAALGLFGSSKTILFVQPEFVSDSTHLLGHDRVNRVIKKTVGQLNNEMLGISSKKELHINYNEDQAFTHSFYNDFARLRKAGLRDAAKRQDVDMIVFVSLRPARSSAKGVSYRIQAYMEKPNLIYTISSGKLSLDPDCFYQDEFWLGKFQQLMTKTAGGLLK